jgi:hypothetical protein
MEKLPDSLLNSFWQGLSQEWRDELSQYFDLPEEIDHSHLRKMLSSKHIGINVMGNPFDDPINFKHINPLKYFTELEDITLSNTSIGSLSPLAGLNKLKSLRLTSCMFDSSKLVDLIQLEELSIWSSDINNTKFIKGLTNLKKLDLVDTEISDIESLSSLTKLSNFNCWGKHLYDNQLTTLSKKLPKCKVNELKKSFDTLRFINDNPDAEFSDFGYETIDLTDNNDKWTFKTAPPEMKEYMLEIKELVFDFLYNEYYPTEFDDEDVEQNRLTINHNETDFFIISSNHNQEPKIHLISCDDWEFFCNNE